MEESDDVETYLFKMVIIWDSAVRKSNLLSRFSQNESNPNSKDTIGVEFQAHRIIIDRKEIKSQIWGTVGQEKFRAITSAYYHDAVGALIVYVVTCRTTFDEADKALFALVDKEEDLESYSDLIEKAEILIQIAMARLEDEFHHLMIRNTVPLDAEDFCNVVNEISIVNWVLNGEQKLNSWIDYDENLKFIEVRAFKSRDLRPSSPIISCSINLSNALWIEAMYVGTLSDRFLYKGTISNGVEIAVIPIMVTSAKGWSIQGEAQFRGEISVLSKVNQENFMNLIGFFENEASFTRMMGYEYSANGTLFEHLYIKEIDHLEVMPPPQVEKQTGTGKIFTPPKPLD